MSNELKLKIEFLSQLSEPEQTEFWDELIELFGTLKIKAGGGQDGFIIDWILDYSTSQLDKGEIIDEIGDFLMAKENLIFNFSIK